MLILQSLNVMSLTLHNTSIDDSERVGCASGPRAQLAVSGIVMPRLTVVP